MLDALAAKSGFHIEARYQRCCQHPGCENPRAPWQAHHVIYKQHVEKLAPELVYDPRNSMRLCNDCHHNRQHNRSSPVPVRAIRDETIEFAVEIMGLDQAVNYFDRYYNNTGGDPRLKAAYWREGNAA